MQLYQTVSSALEYAGSLLWGPATLAAFVFTGFYLSARTRFFQFTHVKTWLNGTIIGAFRNRGKDGKNGVSPFQATCAALAACVGTGNIVGVASAICLGGPGAVFWMWVASALGMMTCCCENILAVKYRVRSENGWHSGPMAYLERGIKSPFLAKMYALFCTAAAFCMGNMTQSNAVSESLRETFGFNKFAVGAVMCALCGVVILGGVKRIAQLAEKLVPLSCVVFVVFAFVCIAANYKNIPVAFASIFSGAFGIRSAGAGIAAHTFSQALRYGISRGVFSNEAGLGTASIIHGEAETDSPAAQGMWGIFEVFADTPVMCTVTALVILCSGVYTENTQISAAVLTQAAFEQTLGKAGSVFLSLSVCVFAFATVIGWCCYGEKTASYLSPRTVTGYRWLYIATVFIGAVLKIELVWNFADILNVFLAAPNLLALNVLSKQATDELTYRR